ncbi:MAG: class I SAM-dependent methyltransferase [Ktedonobacteraceae bacterium]
MHDNITIWSERAEDYDAYRPSPPMALVGVLTQLAQMPHPHCIVDIGSGTGLSTTVWAEVADTVIGIEPNTDMRRQAEHRTHALANVRNITYRDGISSKTNLPDESADIVTCSQSLHWMEPAPTFAEIARILRPGGVFAAYDYDWPPTMNWEVEQAYDECMDQFERMRIERNLEVFTGRGWAKEQHLERMQASGHFRYVKEILLHSMEMGNAKRLIGLALSNAIAPYLHRGLLNEQEIGLDRFKQVAQEHIGDRPIPWYFSYHVRIGVK